MKRHFGSALPALLVLLLTQSSLSQQKNELAGVLGHTFITHQTVPGANFPGNSVAFGNGLSFTVTYSRLLKVGGVASLSGEVPVQFDADEDLNYGRNVIPEGYRAYFVTPAARVTLFPRLPVTPWGSLGGGFGHFGVSSKLEFGGANPGKTGSTTGVLQFGGGVDVSTWRLFSLRAEARDFYSGVPQLNVNTGKSHQQNLFVGVGIVWHFGR
jgi:hypothetical protein